jgi:hypothetical protein
VRAVGLGDFHHRQHVTDRIHPGTAVFGRDLDAHQAVFAQGADVLQREFAGAVVVFGAGRDLLPRDAAGHVLQHQLLFAETKLHGALRIVAIDTNCTAGASQTPPSRWLPLDIA